MDLRRVPINLLLSSCSNIIILIISMSFHIFLILVDKGTNVFGFVLGLQFNVVVVHAVRLIQGACAIDVTHHVLWKSGIYAINIVNYLPSNTILRLKVVWQFFSWNKWCLFKVELSPYPRSVSLSSVNN